LFPHLLGNVRLLASAVDGHLNREGADVRPLNLMHRLPEDDLPRAQLIVEQRARAYELCQVGVRLSPVVHARLARGTACDPELSADEAAGGTAPDTRPHALPGEPDGAHLATGAWL
jgi:hypothetical protein